LNYLRLHSNSLTGPIPASLGNLDSCFVLELQNNNLEGCFPPLANFCSVDERLSARFGDEFEYNTIRLQDNPGLPWNGDFSRFCAGEDQIGAPCDDGDPITGNDAIQEDCGCRGEMISCRQRDSLSLVALYNSTNGSNWSNPWDLSQSLDTWTGVYLNENGCVRSLQIENNNLVGNLPSELGELQNLKEIYLSGNKLSGPIPSELGNVVNLEILSLWNNQLSQEIPESLGNLLNLRILHLFGNQLSGAIPGELGNLSQLQLLSIWNNQLSGAIPASLGNLSALRELSLFGNLLSGEIPPSLGDLFSLQWLSLQSNQLQGSIPAELGNLDSCYSIQLADNQLEGCFPDLANFCSIQQRLFNAFGTNDRFNIVDFSNNPSLPWNGDFARYCAGEDQIGAPCDDGDPNTVNDIIQEDCDCRGEVSFGCSFQVAISSKTLPTCPGSNDGQISVEVTGDFTSLSFIWKDEGGSVIRTVETTDATDQLTGLSAGSYFLAVSDGFCSDSISLTFNAINEIQLRMDSIANPTCAGAKDGFIGVTAIINNVQETTFQWSKNTLDDALIVVDMKSTEAIYLAAGTYALTISDGNCSIDTSFIITDPRPLNINQPAVHGFITQPDCPNGLNGVIDLGFAEGVIGGTPFSDRTSYNFRWYDLEGGNNILAGGSSIRDLSAGTYGLYIEDANGCSDSTTFNLVAGPTVNIAQDVSNICRGDSLAQLSVSGDLAGNTVIWSTGDETPTITDLKAGTYQVSVTEMVGDVSCTTVDSFEIIDWSPLVNVISPMQFELLSKCNEPDSGIIFGLQLDYPGSTGFIWHSVGELVTNVPILPVNKSGIYPYSAVDKFTGCIIYQNEVSVAFQEGIKVFSDVSINCEESNDNQIEVFFETPKASYEWWSTSEDANMSLVSFENLENGTRSYDLSNTIYYLSLKNDSGCVDTLVFDLSLDGSSTINLVDDYVESAKGETEINVLNNDDVVLDNIRIDLLDANYPTKIHDLGQGLFKVEIPPSTDGRFTATYRVCERDCSTRCDTAKIEVQFNVGCGNPDNYRLPNVITPFDANGENDELKVIFQEDCQVVVEQLNIINRWGDPVWSSKEVDDFWKGLNDQGEALPEGTYYYQVKLSLPGNGIPIIKTGHVTLLR